MTFLRTPQRRPRPSSSCASCCPDALRVRGPAVSLDNPCSNYHNSINSQAYRSESAPERLPLVTACKELTLASQEAQVLRHCRGERRRKGNSFSSGWCSSMLSSCSSIYCSRAAHGILRNYVTLGFHCAAGDVGMA